MPTIIKSGLFGGTKFLEGADADAEMLKSGIFPHRIRDSITREAKEDLEEAVSSLTKELSTFVVKEIENATKTVCVVVEGERHYLPKTTAKKLGLIK